MATYAIGDVQGCMNSLRQLIEKIQFAPDRDRLWFVGDLVNRGPDSLTVLRYVKGLGSAAVTVLGNHDLHLLAVAAGVTDLQKKDSFHDVLSAPDGPDLLNWLRRQPLIHQEQGFLLVHAGLLPQWTISQAVNLAREVEALLRSDDFSKNLPFIYFRNGKKDWNDDLSAQDRCGLATNVMTRIRVCSPEGVPDFSFKGPVDQIPHGLKPWFQIPLRANQNETIIFGHWSALGVVSQDNVLCLDAGCVWGKELVALRLEDRRLFQVPCGN
ncbi:MAG: symmetrical bis(5'-nucleosyl)-tetraphosphatase [Nitrospirota bacterium]|nr:MAG: symmetrical bis(5'-nucleosyl)-tetraphosphatase [Nitrospirota bacterium]